MSKEPDGGRIGSKLGLIMPVLAACFLAASSRPGFTAPGGGGTPDPICAPEPAPRPQPEGTRQMISILKRLQSEANPLEVSFMNNEAVEISRKVLQKTTNARDGIQQEMLLAQHLLRAGRSQEALKQYEQLERDLQTYGVRMGRQQIMDLNLDKITCWLRIGEQENCISNHTSQSCLLPISQMGVHRLSRGSQGAIDALTRHLQVYTNDMSGIWLMNVAHMTLGSYPDGVPAQWRIPPKVFASDHDIKRFPEVGSAAGVDVTGLAGGSIAEDFNGDGYLDLMVSDQSWDGQLQFLHNNADGTFSNRTKSAGLLGITGGLNIIQTDYNNDGFPDVLVLRGGWLGNEGRIPNSLLRNNGNGTFDDVTSKAGLLSYHPTQTAAWFDYDGDGWLDLFIGNESWVDEGEMHPCELFHNNRDGTFTDVAAKAGVDIRHEVKGVVAGDFNNDGRTDLYLSTRDGANLLLRNDGPDEKSKESTAWKFTDIGSEAGVAEPMESFPTACFDYDNDGWLDILVIGYQAFKVGDVAADYLGQARGAARARLYHNDGDGTFTDVTAKQGLYKILLGMGLNYGDLDNDGCLDFYVGTGNPGLDTLIPNRMFRNNAGKRFQDVTTSGGFGHLQKGHGISFADLDNDGDQDVHAVMGGAFSGDTYQNALFRNPGHGNHWITLKLEGTKSNRPAIGAVIKATVQTPSGERTIYKHVSTGASFGASPFRLEIGLGNATSLLKLEIKWPSGTTTTLANLAMDQFYKLKEGATSAEVWNLKRFSLPDPDSKAAHQHAPVPIPPGL